MLTLKSHCFLYIKRNYLLITYFPNTFYPYLPQSTRDFLILSIHSNVAPANLCYESRSSPVKFFFLLFFLFGLLQGIRIFLFRNVSVLRNWEESLSQCRFLTALGRHIPIICKGNDRVEIFCRVNQLLAKQAPSLNMTPTVVYASHWRLNGLSLQFHTLV